MSQLGVVAVGLATASTTGTVWHLVNHALFKSLLFLCAGAVVHLAGVERLSGLELLLLAVSLAGGLLLAAGAVRPPVSRWIGAAVRPLRAVQTGSVNDYAGYLTLGVLAVAGTLLL